MDDVALFCGQIVLVFVEKGRCCAVLWINCFCYNGKWTILRYFVDTLFLFSWKMDDVALFSGQIVLVFVKNGRFCAVLVVPVFIENGRCGTVLWTNCSCFCEKWTILRCFEDKLFLLSWKMDDVAQFCRHIVLVFMEN